MQHRCDDWIFMIFKPQICLFDGKIRKFSAEKLLKCSVVAYWLGLTLDVGEGYLYRRHQLIFLRFRRELDGSLRPVSHGRGRSALRARRAVAAVHIGADEIRPRIADCKLSGGCDGGR